MVYIIFLCIFLREHPIKYLGSPSSYDSLSCCFGHIEEKMKNAIS